MNPTLTQWLDNYNAARAQYMDETRLLPVDALMPERPREMQFTITSTGLLRDADGRRVGHATEMNEAAFNALGLEMGNLTARQRRTPMPRRNPDTTRLTAALRAEHDAEVASFTPPAPATWGEDFIPFDAAPGDIVTDSDNRRIGIVGRNGRNEVVVVRDPNPMHDRLRRPLATVTAEDLQAAVGTPVVTGLDVEQERTIMESLNAAMNAQPNPFVTGPIRLDQIHTPNLSASAVSYDRISNALSSVSETIASNMGTSRERALDAAEAALTGREPEVYVGPRMLATIAQPPASAERYAEHAAGPEQAHLRAGQIYHQRPSLYGSAVRRASTEAPNGATVDRNAGAVTTFLSEGYGIELNEEALNAVSAMVNTFCRMAALPHITRADGLQANVESLDREVVTLMNRVREAEADAQHTGTVVDGVLTPATASAASEAIEAARVWKTTGHEDSVAKLASFKHLLDTLENLAR